jgi:hypothetical protein
LVHDYYGSSLWVLRGNENFEWRADCFNHHAYCDLLFWKNGSTTTNKRRSKVRKLFLTVLFLGMMVCVASAEIKMPPLKEGIAYSVADSRFNFLSTIELASYKGFSVEVGYAGAAKNTGSKAVGVVSYEIANLKKLGVTMPLLDLVSFNLGYYAGFGRISVAPGETEGNNEFDHGISLTLIQMKF